MAKVECQNCICSDGKVDTYKNGARKVFCYELNDVVTVGCADGCPDYEPRKTNSIEKTYEIYDWSLDGKLVGRVTASSKENAALQWQSFAGPGKYLVTEEGCLPGNLNIDQLTRLGCEV